MLKSFTSSVFLLSLFTFLIQCAGSGQQGQGDNGVNSGNNSQNNSQNSANESADAPEGNSTATNTTNLPAAPANTADQPPPPPPMNAVPPSIDQPSPAMANAAQTPAPVAPDSADVKPASAEKNRADFLAHMANLLGGHIEGVFVVKAELSAIYATPDDHSTIVGYLQAGDDVHAVSIEKGWVEIGENKYVVKADLSKNNARTPGAERYPRPLER